MRKLKDEVKLESMNKDGAALLTKCPITGRFGIAIGLYDEKELLEFQQLVNEFVEKRKNR